MNAVTQALARPVSVALLPLVVRQARRVQRETPRLPAAERLAGTAGEGAGRPVRLLVIGDSTAAGVGVDDNADGLAGRLAAELAVLTGTPVAWETAARIGATAERAAERLAPEAAARTRDGRPPDAVVAAVGMNDVLRFHAPDRWRAGVQEIAAAVRSAPTGKPGGPPLVFTGVPPVGRVPALPQPLRAVLGARSRLLDRVLAEAALDEGARYAAMPPLDGPQDGGDLFAADRFHPSAAGYRLLAREFAPIVHAALAAHRAPSTAEAKAP